MSDLSPLSVTRITARLTAIADALITQRHHRAGNPATLAALMLTSKANRLALARALSAVYQRTDVQIARGKWADVRRALAFSPLLAKEIQRQKLSASVERWCREIDSRTTAYVQTSMRIARTLSLLKNEGPEATFDARASLWQSSKAEAKLAAQKQERGKRAANKATRKPSPITLALAKTRAQVSKLPRT